MKGLVIYDSQGNAYTERQLLDIRAIVDKPLLLFVGSSYYPEGGIRDHVGAYATAEDALQQLPQHRERIAKVYGGWFWWHVVNRISMQIVQEGADP